MATTGDNSPLQEQWMRATDSGDLERVRALLAAHPELLNARVDHPVNYRPRCGRAENVSFRSRRALLTYRPTDHGWTRRCAAWPGCT